MTIDRYVPSVMKRPKMESTNVVAVVQMLTQGVPNTSTLFAPQLFTLTKSVQLLYAALQVYSTPIASTFSLPPAIKRRLACYIASTWTDFCAVFLTRMPITCRCCNKLKVHFILCPLISGIDQSTGFNEFIHERETKPPHDPSIMLFDQVILSKRNRGRTSLFSKSKTDFLSDTSDHLWRSAAATPPKGKIPGDYRAIITRSTPISRCICCH